MKILQLLDEPWDSGITSYAIQISEHLQKTGHDVVLGVHFGKKPEKLARQKKITVARINSVLDLFHLFKADTWDVINVHSGRSHTWMVLSAIFLHKACPIVRTRGDARPLSVNFLSKFVYRHTSAVIAASDHISKQYIEDLSLNPEYCSTVYPSVNSDDQVQTPMVGRVGILGRLDPVKGHSGFLEAAALVVREVPHARFVIAGKEAGISVSLLQNQANLLGVSQAVEFVGFQPSAEKFMSSCEVGVIASIGSEEISRACLEWLAVGRPVVGTLVGSLPELIEPGENGFLVSPGDSAAMARNIVTLLNDRALRERLSRNALRTSKLKFSADIEVERTLEIYGKAIRRVGRDSTS